MCNRKRKTTDGIKRNSSHHTNTKPSHISLNLFHSICMIPKVKDSSFGRAFCFSHVLFVCIVHAKSVLFVKIKGVRIINMDNNQTTMDPPAEKNWRLPYFIPTQGYLMLAHLFPSTIFVTLWNRPSRLFAPFWRYCFISWHLLSAFFLWLLFSFVFIRSEMKKRKFPFSFIVCPPPRLWKWIPHIFSSQCWFQGHPRVMLFPSLLIH